VGKQFELGQMAHSEKDYRGGKENNGTILGKKRQSDMYLVGES